MMLVIGFFNLPGAIKEEDLSPEPTDETVLLKSMEINELKGLYSEEFILDFLQLPDDAVELLKEVAKLHGVKWVNYLNALFNELKPNYSMNWSRILHVYSFHIYAHTIQSSDSGIMSSYCN